VVDGAEGARAAREGLASPGRFSRGFTEVSQYLGPIALGVTL
jgi:hypothetical protein